MQHHDHISIGELRAHLSAFIHCKMQPDGHTKYTKCIKRSFQTCLHASVCVQRATRCGDGHELTPFSIIFVSKSHAHANTQSFILWTFVCCLIFKMRTCLRSFGLRIQSSIKRKKKRNNNHMICGQTRIHIESYIFRFFFSLPPIFIWVHRMSMKYSKTQTPLRVDYTQTAVTQFEYCEKTINDDQHVFASAFRRNSVDFHFLVFSPFFFFTIDRSLQTDVFAILIRDKFASNVW